MALFFAASAVALSLGEVAVRLVAPQQLILLRPDIWRPADSVGWANQLNVHTEVNTGDRTVSLVTDGEGFRIAKSGRPSGGYRVLLIGDSFMQALQVEYEQSVAGLLEKCFADRTGQTLSVWNTAVSGWDPPQYYFQAMRTVTNQHFDIVLVALFLGNDIVSRRLVLPPRKPWPKRSFRVPRNLQTAEFIDAILAPANDALETRSHLFVFVKNRSQSLLMTLGLTAIELPSELRRSEAASPRWHLAGEILSEIDSVAAANGAPMLVALIPSIEEVVPSALQDRARAFGVDVTALDVDQPDSIMVSELQSRGLAFVSLLRPLREAAGRGVALYGQVDPHPSAAGHQVMWNAIAPVVAERLGLTYDWTGGSDPACDLP